MTMTNPNDDMLDDIFAQARATDVTPSDDLMARVLGDAADVQAEIVAPVLVPQEGLWTRMLDTIGGWPAVSSLAAATVAGVWIGVAPPATVQDLTAGMIGDEVGVSLFPTDLGFEAGAFADG